MEEEFWIAAIPLAWINPDQDRAQYGIEFERWEENIEGCPYGNGYTLIRRRINVGISIVDLETGKKKVDTNFSGGTPGSCPQTESFHPAVLTKYRDGSLPDFAAFESWLLTVLQENQDGSVGLLPGVMSPPDPEVEIPSDIEALALSGVEQNGDWTPYIHEFDGVEMVLVPAGCFKMGSQTGSSDERPVHEVCFERPFWIDLTEVTNAQFENLGGRATVHSTGTDPQQPRDGATWVEVNAYCLDRDARLPTEAEWEYAARGPAGRAYPWGNEFVMNNAVGYGIETLDVGSQPDGASWVGALDLSGNVWEWVSDWFGPYTAEKQINSTGPDSGSIRVLRGGSY